MACLPLPTKNKGKGKSELLSSGWMPLMHTLPPKGCSFVQKHRHCFPQAACNVSIRKGQVCEREGRGERLKDPESTNRGPQAGQTDRHNQVGLVDHCGIVSAGLRAPLPEIPLSFRWSEDSPASSVSLPKAGDTLKKLTKKKSPIESTVNVEV